MALVLIETVVSVLLIAGALFAPAGGLDWPMAWAFLAVYCGIAAVGLAVVPRALLVERSGLLAKAELGDAILSVTFFALLYPGTFIACGLDRRLSWSPPVPVWLQLAALAVFVGGYAFALWAMRANPFFTTVVRIQDERGHRVVDGGPYRWVRHPGYSGGFVAHLALPLALGSVWSLVVAAAGCLLMAARTIPEERTLRAGLPGYAEYARRVRWRMVPGVW